MRFATETARLEAFSDGVLAVIITIMVLELHPPHETTFASLSAVTSTFLAYVLSFVFIGIYWNNHHHMLRASVGVDGAAMWANLHLLFWLSLTPFTTAWLGAHPRAPAAAAVYGIVLMMCAIAYFILTRRLVIVNGPGTPFTLAVQRDFKGRLSLITYIVGVVVAFVAPLAAEALYIIVAIVWLIPEQRFEDIIDVHRRA